MIDREKSLEELRNQRTAEIWAERGIVIGGNNIDLAGSESTSEELGDDIADMLPRTAELNSHTLSGIIKQAIASAEHIKTGAISEVSAGHGEYLRSAQLKQSHLLSRRERQNLSDQYFHELRILKEAGIGSPTQVES